MNKTANVVIIGGGISGCSIAYNLAKKGVKDIVVIERQYLASGSTGRCGAGIRMQWGTERNCRLSKLSTEFYENANEELGAVHDIEFKQGGYLIVAATEKEVEQFKRMWLCKTVWVFHLYIFLQRKQRKSSPIWMKQKY